MDLSQLKSFKTIFPIIIDKYETFIPNIEGQDIIQKMNSIIEYLNNIGKLNNGVINNWNKVMKWIIEEGLTESVNVKIDELVASGQFDDLIQTALNEMNTTTNQRLNSFESSLTQTTTEGTGYGVVNGLLVEPQTWPIRDMTCQMSAGAVYMPDGKRFSFNSIGVIPIDASHATLNRRDIVYVSSSGVISVLKGTGSTGDAVPPSVPSGGLLLAIVTIKTGQTVIDTNVVQDKRYFKYNNNQLTEQLQNAKSSNALSVRPSEGIITKMLNYAQTYVKNVDKFAYGAPTAFYGGAIYTDANGKFLMNCSTFGHLMQKGIPFENSKYGGVPENILDPNFNDMVPVTDDLFTYDFAKWAFDNGFGYVPDPDFKNVMAGDAIFFSWANPSAQLPKHSASFMNLDHTSMFVELNPDGSFVVYEDGNLPSLTTYPASYRTQVKYCCRLPFNSVDLDIKNLIVGGNTQITSTGKSVVNTYSLSKSLENHKWYTAVIKGTIQTAGCWFNVFSGSTLLYSGKLHGIKPNGLYTFHFCTKGLDLSANNITISLVAESETAVPSSTRNCIVDWFVLTAGFTNSIKEYVSGENSKPVFTFLNGFTGSYVSYRTKGFCVVSVRVSNPSTIATGSLVDIGNISGITLKNTINIPADINQQLLVSPSYSSDGTAWVSTSDTPPYRLRFRNGNVPSADVRYLDIYCVLPIEE